MIAGSGRPGSAEALCRLKGRLRAAMGNLRRYTVCNSIQSNPASTARARASARSWVGWRDGLVCGKAPPGRASAPGTPFRIAGQSGKTVRRATKETTAATRRSVRLSLAVAWTRSAKHWSPLGGRWPAGAALGVTAQASPQAQGSYLVDPASSHMLVSKIKPCMSKYKLLIL